MDGFNSWRLGRGSFQQVPDPHTEREILYTTYAKHYMRERKRMRKKARVYVCSALKSDETLDDIKDLNRILLDETIYSEPISVDELSKSLCILMI